MRLLAIALTLVKKCTRGPDKMQDAAYRETPTAINNRPEDDLPRTTNKRPPLTAKVEDDNPRHGELAMNQLVEQYSTQCRTKATKPKQAWTANNKTARQKKRQQPDPSAFRLTISSQTPMYNAGAHNPCRAAGATMQLRGEHVPETPRQPSRTARTKIWNLPYPRSTSGRISPRERSGDPAG